MFKMKPYLVCRKKGIAIITILFLAPFLLTILLAIPPSGSGLGWTSTTGLQSLGLAETTVERGIPLVFVENVGQFDQPVQFRVNAGHETLFLTEDALWLSLIEPPSGAAAEMMRADNFDPGSHVSRQVNLKLSFVGANSHPRLEPFDRIDARFSFFDGNDPANWHAGVPAWGGVRYVDLYPGVDLEITGKEGKLAQRLIVREPSSLRDVRLRVEGAEGLALDGRYLHLATLLGDLALPLMVAQGSAIDFGSDISVSGDGYQVTAPFVPESSIVARASAATTPELIFGTYLGGRGDDRAYDIALDDWGNVYVTGRTSSPDFPTTPGVHDRHYGGGTSDVFVARLSADGSTLLSSTYLGGSDEDVGMGVRVDGAGNVYVTGWTYSPDFPTTSGALDRTLSGGRDAFVAKLNAAGDELVYSTYLGGSSWDYGFCLDIDGAGSAYVGGFTHGGFPVTSGAAQTTFGGSGDGFAAKLSPDGSTLLYSTYIGGFSYEGVEGIAVDDVGNAYLATHTHSTDFPTTPGAWDRTCDNCQTNVSTDAAVAKVNGEGSAFVYSTLVGGADPDGGEAFTDIAVDGAGNAYLTGHTSSSDFPTTPDALGTGFSGGVEDAVVVKLNSEGSDLLYSTYLGGSGNDRAYGIVIDGDGVAYVVGYTNSTDFATVDPLQAANAGGYDAFVARINDTGSTLLYSTYIGGAGDENCYDPPQGHADIVMDGMGNIFLTGFTNSTDLPITDAYDVSFNGGVYDGFVFNLGYAPPFFKKRAFLPLIVLELTR